VGWGNMGWTDVFQNSQRRCVLNAVMNLRVP
jgi:hypothetical protein